MHATTIKLDGMLIKRLTALKPRDETLSAFVRGVLDAEIRRRQLRVAAENYAEFLRAHPEEADEMGVWATASLERKPRARRTR